MNYKIILISISLILMLTLSGCLEYQPYTNEEPDPIESPIIELVNQHAQARATGDLELLDSLLHEDVVFAYPGRRLNKEQTLEDLAYFKDHFRDTKVYINNVIIEDDSLAVEWQFATTNIKTGHRQVVSDAIIGKVQDNQFIVWKEYLDGRVKQLQAEDKLFLEEGEEPFPWPLKTKLYIKK